MHTYQVRRVTFQYSFLKVSNTAKPVPMLKVIDDISVHQKGWPARSPGRVLEPFVSVFCCCFLERASNSTITIQT